MSEGERERVRERLRRPAIALVIALTNETNSVHQQHRNKVETRLASKETITELSPPA